MRTISKTLRFSGIGLHSGEIIHVTLSPSLRGISFNNIKVNPETVIGSSLCTKIQTEDTQISTIEHLMCTLFILGIDSLNITLDGDEIPILDGSAWEFYNLLKDSLEEISESRVLEVPYVEVQEEDKFIRVNPSKEFKVKLKIDFNGLIQEFTYPNNLDFLKARTFCYLRDIEYMQTHNLALGGSLHNAIVLDSDNRVINPEGFRLENELAKHKMIDFLGDLYTIQVPLRGEFECYKPGHQLNNRFVKELSKSLRLLKSF